jgi:hypothetical protein
MITTKKGMAVLIAATIDIGGAIATSTSTGAHAMAIKENGV